MVEIYLMVSLAPIPFATFGNHEQSHTGQNLSLIHIFKKPENYLCLAVWLLFLFSFIFLLVWLLIRGKAVSYTHLEVYKRQGEHMEYLYKVLGIKATVQRAEFDHLPNYIAVRSVSYTHL